MDSIKKILQSPEMRRLMPEETEFMMRQFKSGANQNAKTSERAPARQPKVKIETSAAARKGSK